MTLAKLRAYYSALKPERTYANVMTTGAGFLFASHWHIDWAPFGYTLLGTTLIVMSACAGNNCIDSRLDARMPSKRGRATATGEVSVRRLAVIAAVLGLVGFAILAVHVNWLTVLLGVIGYVDYVVLYTWSKRITPYSTLIGTVSGAVPMVAGYTAVANRFDLAALLLGFVMVFWQMVHFYAIGVFRLADYQAGGLPVWPVRHGVRSAQAWMLAYTALYVLALIVLAVYESGWVFGVTLGGLGLYWLGRGVVGFCSADPTKWARSMFGFSLVTLLALSVGVAFTPLLP